MAGWKKAATSHTNVRLHAITQKAKSARRKKIHNIKVGAILSRSAEFVKMHEKEF